MGRSSAPAALVLATLLAACLPRGASSSASREPSVRIELTDVATGRLIFSAVLADHERAVLTWTNSLYRLPVTDVFVARDGHLELTSTTYGDPSGKEPPLVSPEDAPDMVQTGGPFRAEGLSRRIDRIVFRVGEVGRPTFRVGDRAVHFYDEVGFGGAVELVVR